MTHSLGSVSFTRVAPVRDDEVYLLCLRDGWHTVLGGRSIQQDLYIKLAASQQDSDLLNEERAITLATYCSRVHLGIRAWCGRAVRTSELSCVASKPDYPSGWLRLRN